jgi:NADH-quinone oxidoreductase subunit H
VALGVVVFLGGWQGPLLAAPVWFLLKVLGLAALTLWAVRFMPRLRHDQMLALAWKILLPASLVNVALVGILILFIPGVSQ